MARIDHFIVPLITKGTYCFASGIKLIPVRAKSFSEANSTSLKVFPFIKSVYTQSGRNLHCYKLDLSIRHSMGPHSLPVNLLRVYR